MIAAGLVPKKTKHNGHRRAHFHDYNRPGVYMITIVTEGRQQLFGQIVGHTRGLKGTEEYPHLRCSVLGERILQKEIAKIPAFYKMVEVMKVALMPDHIHLLLNVKGRLPEGKHLGNVVRGFKTGCTRAWWQLQDEQEGKSGGETGRSNGNALGSVGGTVSEASPSGGCEERSEGCKEPSEGCKDRSGGGKEPSEGSKGWRPVLFEAGYHDRIIIRDGMLENICRYMDENPFRARLREERPNLMQRRLHLWIQDREYAAFGNLFLLKNPDRIQVFFHRKNKEGVPTHLTPEYVQDKEKLLKRAEEGAVLVTPGISKGEKGVVDAALDDYLPLILLQKEPISEYWKPSQERFYACASGRLLILAPWQIDGDSDYARFHSLNDLAHDICEATDTRLLNS